MANIKKKLVKGKKRAKMNVQPTSLARSRANRAKRRGRKATKRGRPYKDVGKKVVVDGKLNPAQAAPKKKAKI